ncbi:MAG: nitroreductase family deazaflavin-dependent oxidoreductase [Candidatus Hodarchaeota archaeon]
MSNSQNKICEELLPRPGSALYNMNHPDEKIREKTLKKYKRLNKYLVIPLYRSRILPLLGFGRIFLILITIGRKTGKERRTPLEYHWIDGIITIFSGRGEDSGWLKNIRANPDSVYVRHGFHKFPARIKFMSNENDILKIIRWYVVKHSKSAKMLFGWNKKIDDPKTTDFSKLMDIVLIIQLFDKEKET